MKEILKSIYKEYLIEDIKQFDFKDYYYFEEINNKIFGVLKSKITDNEMKLISTYYDLVEEDLLLDENRKILNFLFGLSEDISITHLKYYMIKFFNLNDEELMMELNNLLKESINQNASIFRKQNIYIIILEKDEDIHFEEILQSIETDFLLKLIGYESDYYEVNQYLPTYFQIDFNNFKGYSHTNEIIINKVNLLTNHLLVNIDHEIIKMIKQYILKDYLNDNEMLRIIKTYFESNFNATLASKNCYMHRNTFLNKLDKFMASTNFNLRNYDEAFMVYIAIIM